MPIVYKDRTYCGSKVHKPDCTIAVTPELIKSAAAFGLPIAMADYCGGYTDD